MLIEKPFTRSTLLGAIRTLCGPQPGPDGRMAATG